MDPLANAAPNYFELLPSEVKTQIAGYVDDSSLRKVSKDFRESTDNALKDVWRGWKNTLPEDAPLRMVMKPYFYSKDSEGSIGHFEHVTRAIESIWNKEKSNLQPEFVERLEARIPICSNVDAIELLNEGILSTNKSNNSLFSFWSLLNTQFKVQNIDLSGSTLPSTASELRSWFKDPKNQQYLDKITELNFLTEIPEEIGYLKNLKIISAKTEGLPQEIAKLEHLESLTFRNTATIKVLPTVIFDCKSLKSLNLSNNQITVLPEEIGQLENLQELNLSLNSLSILPQEIFNLRKLRKFDLYGNAITQIPSEIEKLSQLTILYLVDNQISQLPRTFGSLSNLKSLNLSGNPLNQLPPFLGNLSELIYLKCDDTHIQTIPANIRLLQNLTHLSLANNQISEIPKEILYLQKLQNLDLDTNQLTTLPDEMRHLNALKILNVINNPLSSLPPHLSETPIEALYYLGTMIPASDTAFIRKRGLDYFGYPLTL